MPRGASDNFIVPVSGAGQARVVVVSVSRGLLTPRKMEVATDGTVVLSDLEPTFRNELNVRIKNASSDPTRVLLTAFFIESGATLAAVTALGASVSCEGTATVRGMPPGKYAVLGMTLPEHGKSMRDTSIRFSKVVQIGADTQSTIVLDE